MDANTRDINKDIEEATTKFMQDFNLKEKDKIYIKTFLTNIYNCGWNDNSVKRAAIIV